MIAYNCDSNIILQVPFFKREYKHRIRSYNSITRRLSDRGHQVDVQILDNEVSTDFKITIVEDWCETYQLVPTNVHQRNIAERSICTFKANFFISAVWSRHQLHQVYGGQPVGANRAHTQHSSSRHTKPKILGMGIFQR